MPQCRAHRTAQRWTKRSTDAVWSIVQRQ